MAKPVRNFGPVDQKVAEADFFLKRIPRCEYDFFAVRCYASAFVASARSITLALQSVMRHIDGFDPWYGKWENVLREDSVARFFNKFRVDNFHIGDNLVTGGTARPGSPTIYHFSPTAKIPAVPEEDVETACKKHLQNLVALVYDCYTEFGPHIDAHQHYTAEHFATLGKTIEDAEEELYGVRGWTETPGFPDDYRWQMIRDWQRGCEINHLFQEYLGKNVPSPERLPEIVLPAGWIRSEELKKRVEAHFKNKGKDNY